MATAPVVLRGGVPTGLTLSVDLRAIGSDDSGSPTNIALTENTNNKHVYRGTTAAALTGWYNATVKDGSSVVHYTGYVYMSDDTTDHVIVDRYTPETDMLNFRDYADIKAVDGTAGTATKLNKSGSMIIEGTVDNTAFTPTATSFESDDITEATADHYNGRTILFISGALTGQATRITDYALVGGRGKFTYQTITEAPANNDTFIIV